MVGAFFVTFRPGLCFRCINQITMKTLSISSVIAALTAFFLSSLKFELAVSVLVSAGLLATVYADCARPSRPLRLTGASPVPAQRRNERLRLAA